MPSLPNTTDGWIKLCIMSMTLAIIGGILCPYILNSWLVYFDRLPVIVFWHGALLTFVPHVIRWMVPATILTYIALICL
ncbi:unnamed protein product [marine sediment metagenome]|uniref:Uncharacterized protein n=1 Tax=marine sediment metagenome TaxID=412755 RepID=X0T0G5_9ZZZZ